MARPPTLAVDLGRRLQAAPGFHADQQDDGKHRQRIDQRRQQFGLAQSIGMAPAGRPRRQPGRQGREPEGGPVADHAPGVGEQGQRAGAPAGDEFDDGEAGGQDERDAERPAGRPVMVMVAVAAPGVVVVIVVVIVIAALHRPLPGSRWIGAADGKAAPCVRQCSFCQRRARRERGCFAPARSVQQCRDAPCEPPEAAAAIVDPPARQCAHRALVGRKEAG